jgi:LmbE family N-acetylglucosaminyl deacetylase
VGVVDGGDHFVDATASIDRKVEAILCHKSQFGKPHQDGDGPAKWVHERMRQIGEQAGYEYAESFKRLVTG